LQANFFKEINESDLLGRKQKENIRSTTDGNSSPLVSFTYLFLKRKRFNNESKDGNRLYNRGMAQA